MGDVVRAAVSPMSFVADQISPGAGKIFDPIGLSNAAGSLADKSLGRGGNNSVTGYAQGQRPTFNYKSALTGQGGGQGGDGVNSMPYDAASPLGSLASGYQLQGLNMGPLDTSSIDKMKSIAGGGPDGFIAKQQQANSINTQNALDQNARGSNQNFQNTLSSLAQNGGYSGASRERALSGANNNAFARQMDIQRQGMQKDADIQGQGMLKQFDMNQGIQTASNAAHEARLRDQLANQETQKFNINNTLSQIGAEREMDMKKFDQNMSAYNNEMSSAAAKNHYAKKNDSGLLGGLFGF